MHSMITKNPKGDNYSIGKEKLVYFEVVPVKSLTNKIRKWMICPNESLIVFNDITIVCVSDIEDIIDIFIRNDVIELVYKLGAEQKSQVYIMK